MPYCTPPSEYSSVKNGPASPKMKPDLAVMPKHELDPGAELARAPQGAQRGVPAALHVHLPVVARPAQKAAVELAADAELNVPPVANGSPIRVSRTRLMPRVERVQLLQLKRARRSSEPSL